MKIKKYISIILISLLVTGRLLFPFQALAEDVPVDPAIQTQNSAPQEPTAPEAPPAAPTAPEGPSGPSAPSAPDGPSGQAPTAPTAPTAPSGPEKPKWDGNNYTNNNNQEPTQNNELTQTPSENPGNYDGTSSSGNVGDTAINTGDGSNNTSILTTGNNNAAGGNGCCAGGASIVNSGNGAGSANVGNSSSVVNNDTNQSNSAGIANNIDSTTNTGGNDSSYNVGNSSITTGDANTTGTVVTSVNTNVDGVMVSEFNIVDDHNGDIILDFGAGCIAGCAGQTIENSGNGAFSYNEADSSSVVNNTTDQDNLANVSNDIILDANSGYNDANFNTGGDSNITTGDANVSANAITFANNNIAGDIVYGVVNIFGDLVGDIILTQEMVDFICGGACSGPTSVANTGNGAGSTNLANADSEINNNVFQNNDADITNTLVLDATTGNNDSNFNTGGNSNINTGEASIDANILNIANMNLLGGNMWLVIVNEAGNWVGKLFGAPDGSNVAASALMEFIIDPITGGVTATNSGNGAGSVNQATGSTTTNNTINQTNTAVIDNTLNLTANTGGNTTNYNTGGDSNITTGDANIVANIVNFVNNNIVGDGKLVITVVNVFGSWIGDFVTPGSQKADNPPAQGGETAAATSNNQNSGNSNSNNQNNSSNSQNSNSNPAAGNTVIAGFAAVGSFISNIGNSNFGSAGVAGGTNTVVAGIKSTPQIATDAMRINLAWVLLLIPAGAVILIISRKIYLRRTV